MDLSILVVGKCRSLRIEGKRLDIMDETEMKWIIPFEINTQESMRNAIYNKQNEIFLFPIDVDEHIKIV